MITREDVRNGLDLRDQMQQVVNSFMDFSKASADAHVCIRESLSRLILMVDTLHERVSRLEQEKVVAEIGHSDGAVCNRGGCKGLLSAEQYACYCSATNTPPCSACSSGWLNCPECGYDSRHD